MATLLHPRKFRWRLAEIARGELGAREVGNNGGAAVRKYQESTWLEPGSWPWCAAFVCWCYRQTARDLAGFHDPPLCDTRPQTPRAFDFEAWGRKYASLHHDARKVRQGDIVIFRFSHVGIAVEAYSTLLGVSCIEGNTNRAGQRDGDGVWLKSRPISEVRSFVHLYESDTPQTA